MRSHPGFPVSRRHVLGGLATLPALLPGATALELSPPAITAPDQAINIMDFEVLARRNLAPAHFGYIATGVDDDRTVARNHEAFADYQVRARRFNDLRSLSTTTSVYGVPWSSPIYLSAVSAMRAFHPEAETGVARAARSRSTQLMLSSGSSDAPEAVSEARDAPYWQQLYPSDDWSVAEQLVSRAEKAGAAAIVLTVDSPGPRNLETLERATLIDERPCSACHTPQSRKLWVRSPFYSGVDVSRVTAIAPLDITPAYLARLRDHVKVKLIIKGVVTGEDAAIALEAGADGLVVSNHGGRNEETLRATIDCLGEVVAAVNGRVPVFLDGGIRRGTDVFKALALGAAGVGIGRPQAWGLAAFGQSGVEAVLDILNTELANIMRQAGTPSVASITAASVVRTPAT